MRNIEPNHQRGLNPRCPSDKEPTEMDSAPDSLSVSLPFWTAPFLGAVLFILGSLAAIFNAKAEMRLSMVLVAAAIGFLGGLFVACIDRFRTLTHR